MSFPPLAQLPIGTYQCYIIKVRKRGKHLYANIQLMNGKVYTVMIGLEVGGKVYYERVRRPRRGTTPNVLPDVRRKGRS